MLRGAPGLEVVGIDGETEKVGGNEAPLAGLPANRGDDHAVDTGHHPALPETPAHQHRGGDGQQARNIRQGWHCGTYSFIREKPVKWNPMKTLGRAKRW